MRKINLIQYSIVLANKCSFGIEEPSKFTLNSSITREASTSSSATTKTPPSTFSTLIGFESLGVAVDTTFSITYDGWIGAANFRLLRWVQEYIPLPVCSTVQYVY